MKHITLLVAMVLTGSLAFAQINQGPQPKTGSSDGHVLAEQNCFSWSAGNWNETTRSLFTYDQDFNLVEVIDQSYSQGSWLDMNRTTYAYNMLGFNTTRTFEMNLSNSWVNVEKETYTFDLEGNHTVTLKENWDGTGWVPGNRTTFTWNFDGSELQEEVWEYWNGSGAWENQVQYLYTYDSFGSRIKDERFNWDGQGWDPMQRTLRTFNSDFLKTEEVFQNKVVANWEDVWRYTYVYDANNNNTIYSIEQWLQGGWKKQSRWVYEYDDNSNRTQERLENWNGFEYDFSQKCDFEYQTLVGENEYALEQIQFQLFPNPSSGQVTISGAKENSSWEYQVFDNSGRLVHSGLGNGVTENIELNELSSGLYHVVVQSDTQRGIEKLMIR